MDSSYPDPVDRVRGDGQGIGGQGSGGQAARSAGNGLAIDEPSNSDGIVRGLSQAIGGPLGLHAVRPTKSGRFWTAARIVLALTCLLLAMHWVQKAPCRDGAWTNLSQYKYFCYTDVLALYYAEELSEGQVPYQDHAVEYPVLTGAMMGVIGLPVHEYGNSDTSVNQGRLFYDLNALVLCSFGVATVMCLLAVRRRRPWDAAMFALSPALFVTATVNWDLLAVGLGALTMYAWAKRKPVLAGVMLGLAVAAKFYPVLLIGPLVLLALRTGRWLRASTTIGVGIVTWVAVNFPVAALYPEAWRKFFIFNTQRPIDWGTLWYVGAHWPTGNGKYGLSFFTGLDAEANHATLNNLYMALFFIACVGIGVLTLVAKRRPRFAQLAFLVVAAFLITGKVWSQQYVLWLVPLAVLARPRWGAFLAWQAAEVLYFMAFYGELMGASGKSVFPEWVFIVASLARLITVLVMCGYIVRDVLHPEFDAVRSTYGDDPDGGDFDRAPDRIALTGGPLFKRGDGQDDPVDQWRVPAAGYPAG